MDKYLNKIICGDCLEVLKGLPDNSVDLVLTDPPYGIDYSRHIKHLKHNKIENDNNLDWLPLFISEMNRLLKKSGSCYIFCSWHNIEIFKKEIEKHFNIRNMLIWDKGGLGMGDLKTTYGSVYEICLFCNKEPQLLNGNRDSDLLRQKRSGNKLHPTEKPIELIKYLVTKSSNENDIVLDPFLGSGTTAVACKQLKRNYIGIELSEEYCSIAKKRLEQDVLF